jgi:hypothetical protein
MMPNDETFLRRQQERQQTGQQPHQHRSTDPHTGRLYRIVRPPQRLGSPPPALRKAKLDNLALLPASLLPFKAEYQAIANQQAPGTTLVVLPVGDSLSRRTLERVATRMQAKGQPVRVLTNEQLQASAV